LALQCESVRSRVRVRDAQRAADEVRSGCASFVTVVEAADFQECDDLALLTPCTRRGIRRILR